MRSLFFVSLYRTNVFARASARSNLPFLGDISTQKEIATPPKNKNGGSQRHQFKRCTVPNFISCIFLMFAISACNLPSASNDPSINDQAATIVAMTLQAGSTPTAQTVLSTPTAIFIVTKSGPSSFTATENTNCRSGPGKNYARLTTIPGGTTVIIVARYATGSFWVVTPPDGSGNCWVDSTLGTVTGDTTTLPQVTPVASENKDSPERPGSLYYEYSCPFGNLSTVLTWADKANNETGYRVYRNDQMIVELPANSKTYTDNTAIIVGTGISYSVEAFNEAGASEQRTISFKCQ